MEKTIWLCRHGKTEWNLEGRKQGHKDSQLAEQGKAQAITLAKFFGDKNGQLFASTLGRAVSTAQCIYKWNSKLGFQTDDRLKEISFGDLEGLTATEIEQMYPNAIDHFRSNPFSKGFPNGESYRDLSERGMRFLDELDESRVDEIIIVAHEDINRILLTLLLDLPQEDAIKISHPHDVIYKVRGKIVVCLKIDGAYVSDGVLMESNT